MSTPDVEPEVGTHSGAVAPQIFRGEPPRQRGRPEKKRVNPWRRNLELGREFPNQWVLMSEISKVGIGCKERTITINKDKRRLKEWLEREAPLERWQLSVLTKEGTTCTKQLVGRYLHTLTAEEDDYDRVQRRKRYEGMMERRAELKRERELTAKLQNRSSGGAQG